VSNISVIICAYAEERWNDLQAAVASLQKQSLPPNEVIVVIDHNPSLYERAKATFQNILVLQNSQQNGASGARNSGIAVAQGNFIAFLDDDAIAEEDWLQRLAACCADPNVLGAGGFVEPLWTGEHPAWFPHEFSWVVGCSYQDIPEKPIAVRNTFIGCSCFTRQVFETVEGFSHGIGPTATSLMRCEETELCIRALQRWPGKSFLFEPRARIQHRVPPARARWRYFLARCYFEGISKAAIAKRVGTKDSLSSEWVYTLRILPRGVLRCLKDALWQRDPTGFLRAGAIITGFSVTAAGYLIGRVSSGFG
jgi:GT2 family glycosyltransferase